MSSFRRVFGTVAVVAGLTLIAPVQLASAQVGDKDCSDFSYQEEAQAVLDQDVSDPNGLDSDHDGVACESLPHRPAQSSTPTSSQGGSGAVVTIPETSTTTSTRTPVKAPAKTEPQVKVKPVGGVATGGGEPDGSGGGFLIGAGVLLAASASVGMVLYLRRRPS